MKSLPKQYSEGVCHKKDETDIERKSLGVLCPPDLQVLGDVGNHATEHHRQ